MTPPATRRPDPPADLAAPPAADAGAGRRLEYLPLGEIPRAERNPRRHDLKVIAASLARFGCTVAGLRDERTGRLVAGHGRLAALELLADEGADPPEGVMRAPGGEWLVPIVCGWASATDAEAQAYGIADNRAHERGGWDEGLLGELLSELADDADLLAATGYEPEDVTDLIEEIGQAPTLEELEADYGAPQEGDLWPVLRIKVPPPVAEQFYALTEAAGPDDTNRFVYLLAMAQPAPVSEIADGIRYKGERE